MPTTQEHSLSQVCRLKVRVADEPVHVTAEDANAVEASRQRPSLRGCTRREKRLALAPATLHVLMHYGPTQEEAENTWMNWDSTGEVSSYRIPMRLE